MSDELRAAAKHLRGDGRFAFGPLEAWFDGEPEGWVVGRPYRNGHGDSDFSILCTGMDEPEAKAVAVALNAFLDATPADDAEPADDGERLTEDWLRAAGARDPHGRDHDAPPALTALGIGFGVFVRDELNDCWHWCRGPRRLATLRTRRDVRRLLAALGIGD